MDRSWYIDECNRQLNNPTFYEQQDNDKTDTIQKRVTEYVKRMFNDKLIDNKSKQYLIQRDPRPGRFYILPKIHKVNNPGRPIVSSNNHPTERISQFVDYHLKPIVCTVPSYVKDTTDFLNNLANLNRLADTAILGTLDVTSLYTNIPHNEGIEACRFFLQKRHDKHIPTETICDLIRIILNMNNFTFNGRHYLQKHGTAMGTKMAPSFANLFLAKFEHDALRNAPYLPHTWLRFLDDIFFIWTEGSDKLKVFVDYLNNLHPTIKFTCSHSLTNVPFLDVMVSLKDGLIETDLYTKPTDKHQYLLISSCHPPHTKRSIPYSLALRLRRICSNYDTYKQRSQELMNYLVNRGYRLDFLKTQIQRAFDVSRNDALKTKPKRQTDTVPFVITYNPALPNITRIIHKHSHVLYSSDRCKKVFTSLPLVAHRRCKNISDILVRAKLPEPVNTDNSRFPPGSFRCNKNNCTTCPYIEDGRTQYTFNSTGQMNQIKSHITCETSNVIYMIQCTKCNLQYIGETKRRLKERFNEHRRPIINTSSYNPTAVSRHFITGNHTVNHMLLIPLEKLYTNRDLVRKAREAFLIHRGNTLEPAGLNRRDEM